MPKLAIETINDLFLLAAGRGAKPAWMTLDGDAGWKTISSAQVYGRVRVLAAGLARMGVGQGDRVAILSENRWEWPVVDFAALALGAVDVPLYGTLTAEQVGFMLRDCGAKVVVVSTKEQYDKVKAAGELPELEQVVVMDDVPGLDAGATPFSVLISGAAEMEARDAAFDAMVKAARPEDLATIIYTSGTTGEPKGVMLTHGNLACNAAVSMVEFGFNETDSSISFLPLSHVTARHVDYGLMGYGATIAYYPKFDGLAAQLQAVRPTILVAVPRVYEKIRQGVEGKSVGLKKKVLDWALGVGRKHWDETLAGERQKGLAWALADKLVFTRIREAFGGRVRTFVSGGAPLGMDTAGWFADAGIRISEGYGLTETSPVIGVNTPAAHRIGTVGKVLENVEARTAADGELEVRGPSVFKGYWKRDEETAKAFTADGWFCTGDIGKIEDGFLSITDRKKELIKTSGGKFIAPQPIENKLKANLLVSHAAMVGDRHKFACVLISPNFAALEAWAKGQGIAASDRDALVRDAKVVAEYQGTVNRVNADLPRYEAMKRMRVVGQEWSVEEGDLTPSMKLKRRVIEQKYAQEIADFYKDEATSERE